MSIFLFFFKICVLASLIRGKLSETFSCAESKIFCVGTGETYATIQSGLNAAVDGDGNVLFVRSGVYYERVNLMNIKRTSANPLRIVGENGAILDGMGTYQSLFYTYQGGSFFTIENFEIRHSYADGSIFIKGVSNVEIKNNYIHSTFGGGEGIYANPPDDPSTIFGNILIENNEIFNITGKEGVYFSCPDSSCIDGPHEKLMAFNVHIKKNYIHWIANECIDLKNTRNSKVEGNRLEDCAIKNEFGLGLSISTWSFYIEVFNNTFKSMGSYDNGGWAISLSEYGDRFPHSIYIHNNLIYNSPYANGINVRSKSNIVEYNTIYNISGVGIDRGCYKSGCGGHVIRSNLVMNCGGREINVAAGDVGNPSYSDYNLAYDVNGGDIFYNYEVAFDACSNMLSECHSVTGNPNFVNEGNHDFHLQDGSIAIGYGHEKSDIGCFGHSIIREWPPKESKKEGSNIGLILFAVLFPIFSVCVICLLVAVFLVVVVVVLIFGIKKFKQQPGYYEKELEM